MQGALIDTNACVTVDLAGIEEIAFNLRHARVCPIVDVVLSLGNADKSRKSVQYVTTFGPVYEIRHFCIELNSLVSPITQSLSSFDNRYAFETYSTRWICCAQNSAYRPASDLVG